MTITHDKVGQDEDLAREILVNARTIAPCIFSFEDDSEDQKDALAILKRVYKDIAGRGSRLVATQRIGTAAVGYSTAVTSAFQGDPGRNLRSLCGAASAAGLPVGSFPTERALARVWPETY
ncbi:hypothetical protein [Microbacterium saperdae]|uniref:Uncharacterized protein n=1 Tax=Microbacterium saperdae TaxID=69368 RepID=A0A543BQW4_9MICO|nr:hypothetical protein [Microbacterium saperdae]TQL87214.1 hypothetical protein FB560_2881 [Microbacterium saperdae]